MSQPEFFDPPKPKPWTMRGAMRTLERYLREAERQGMTGKEAVDWANQKAWESIDKGLEDPPTRGVNEPF